MKWLLSHATEGLHYWLLQEEAQTQSLIFNRSHNSLRITGKAKRVFFLEVQGFINKKVALCNEYGIVLGETAFADPATGPLTCNDQRFTYTITDNLLSLYDGEQQLLQQCEVPPTTNKLEFYSLLFGFVWLVTADVLIEKTVALPKSA